MLKGSLNTSLLYSLVNGNQKCFENAVKKIANNRKLIVLHGNCQTHVLRNMISSNQKFKDKYLLLETPRLWGGQDEEQWNLFFGSGILALIDVLVVQQISKDNIWGYMKSTEYVISQVSEQCRVITISNLYFRGYFPQLILTHMHDKVAIYQGKIGWVDGSVGVDKEILKLMLEGKGEGYYRTPEEIVEKISADDYYQRDILIREIELELDDFEIREKNVEIKMCDYLRENYDKFLMFVTDVHPTTRVLEEFARRILVKIDITDLEIICDKCEVQFPMPKNTRFVVYPSVLNAFNLPEIEYVVSVELQGEELLLLRGIKPELDRFIEENRKDGKKHGLTLHLNFGQYMLLSARTMQAAIHT